jgi:predicted nucleic acid-binding protein
VAAEWAYVDTSVLVKRYVREEGSRRARDLLRRYRILSSVIAPLEALSALARRRAAGDLARPSFDAIVARLDSDRRHFELVELTAAILARAENVFTRAQVRTLDAVHLASALSFQELSGLRIPFLTADERQREAARRLGLAIVWVA